ncbi:MAG TPA: glutamate--tRNA ligase family protein [Kofleriaceae bacterium]|nr:glutamate--tRNA ligase family protein [Kofleriaceae bacterium]
MISRFAPSTTGEAHPGTLLSALLVWYDARARGGRALLRLEDLDTTRVRAAWADQLVEALAWLGISFDETIVQSRNAPVHEAALDALAAQGRLYPCTCSRADRAGGRRAPDGGWAYANTCRGTPLPPGGWRAATANLRARLPDTRIEVRDEGGADLSQVAAIEMGDPIVRRKDGVIAYQLAVVSDDQISDITDIVRGRDIAPSTATQVGLQHLLGYRTPRYRHHFLLLEPQGEKLAKLHGSIPFSQLRARYTGPELRALLMDVAGQVPGVSPATFDWARVPREDVVVRWDDGLVFDRALVVAR